MNTKKEKEKARQVLTEIISDLEYSLTDFDRVINTRTNNLSRTINSIKTIIDILETDKSYHDSLSSYFRAINAYSSMNFKMSGYQTLVSIGTDLVEDPKLRSSIGQFHTSTINRIEVKYQEIHLDFYSYMIDYYRKEFTTVLNDKSVEKLVPNSFKELKKDKEYIQVFLGINLAYLGMLNDSELEVEKL